MEAIKKPSTCPMHAFRLALSARCARYAIVAFVDFGVYPMLFKLEKPVLARVRNV